MNRITNLLGIKYPIIQAGMIWCSGWELVSAVSNSGGLGLLGSGSMYPEILESQIIKCKEATKLPFGVNIPLLYPNIEDHIKTIIKHKVPIVFTSAGNPKSYTLQLKDHGIKVIHVVSSLKFALKAQEAGVDAVVAEGFEAGGHNGREETTTMCLIPSISNALEIPTIAAGGIASGKAMLAAMILGAEAVQIGSRFIVSHESSAHLNYKELLLKTQEGDTQLTLKELTPVRMLKNEFFKQIEAMYQDKKSLEELSALLGRGRAKKGMFEGDLNQGELEVGQVSASFDKIQSAEEIIEEIMNEFKTSIANIHDKKFIFP